MDMSLWFILFIGIINGVDAVDEDAHDGYEWLILLSAVLAVLIAVVIGGFLYRRKLKNSVPSDQENLNKNEDSQFHTKINEQNKSNQNYGATQVVQGEKSANTLSSASSTEEEISTKTSSTTVYSPSSSSPSLTSSVEISTANGEQLSHKEVNEDGADSLVDRASCEEESLYGSSHKSSREGPDATNNGDPDNCEELKHMNVTEISRASLKRMVEKYISQAGSYSNQSQNQEMEEDTLYIDGAGRYLMNKDTLHLSDLGNQSITSTKKRESLNLSHLSQANESVYQSPEKVPLKKTTKNQKHLRYSWPDPKEIRDLEGSLSGRRDGNTSTQSYEALDTQECADENTSTQSYEALDTQDCADGTQNN